MIVYEIKEKRESKVFLCLDIYFFRRPCDQVHNLCIFILILLITHLPVVWYLSCMACRGKPFVFVNIHIFYYFLKKADYGTKRA